MPWYLMLCLLVLVALTGGSSRADIASLIVLRPVAILLAVAAVAMSWPMAMREYRAIVAVLGAATLLLILHLVPLPPAIWQALPGRGLIREIDAAAGLGNPWRPISLDPLMTRNALWSMAVPIAASMLAMRLDERYGRPLLLCVLAIGVLSGLLGVLQFADGPSSPFYFYSITSNGFSVGLFANRNHQGVFLAALIPLLAAYAAMGRKDGRDRNARAIGAIAVGAMFVPMILATSSRAGFVAMLLGIVSAIGIATPLIKQRSTARDAAKVPRWWIYAAVGAIFLVLCISLVGLTQGNSVDRLLDGGSDGPERRWPFWEITIEAARAFFPLGAGLGSFVRVFQVFEPDTLLAMTYVNHAHNDYVELLLDGGVPALVLMLFALFIVARDALSVWRVKPAGSAITLGRSASVSLSILMLASVVDYPLRTPILAAIACILAVWLRRGAIAAGRSTGD